MFPGICRKYFSIVIMTVHRSVSDIESANGVMVTGWNSWVSKQGSVVFHNNTLLTVLQHLHLIILSDFQVCILIHSS